MEIYQEHAQSKIQNGIPVTVIKLVGDLDGSNFKQVIAKVESACATGTRDLLLDLGEVNFMSSSGLVALHNIALLMRKEQLPDLSEGWSTINAIDDYVNSAGGLEKHFRLLNPQPRVAKTLQQVGFDHVFEIFTNREVALAAFG